MSEALDRLHVAMVRNGIDPHTGKALPLKGPTLDCPRCGEGDERSLGVNRCGLCGCEFNVRRREPNERG